MGRGPDMSDATLPRNIKLTWWLLIRLPVLQEDEQQPQCYGFFDSRIDAEIALLQRLKQDAGYFTRDNFRIMHATDMTPA